MSESQFSQNRKEGKAKERQREFLNLCKHSQVTVIQLGVVNKARTYGCNQLKLLVNMKDD